MNADIKAQWLAALRSDTYKQGICRLRKNDCYCVFGVLCDIVYPSGWRDDTHYGSYTYPDFLVREAAGINEGMSYLDIRTLIIMNDAGKPFTELADFIEVNF